MQIETEIQSESGGYRIMLVPASVCPFTSIHPLPVYKDNFESRGNYLGTFYGLKMKNGKMETWKR